MKHFRIDDAIRYLINRRSYISGHVLLNKLNELVESDKMLGKPHIDFNKFKTTGPRMLDYIYHLTSIVP